MLRPKVRVSYGRPGGKTPESMRTLPEQRKILSAAAQQVDSMFAFQKPLIVHTASCGTPNAFWDPDHRELRICYERLEAFLRLRADRAVAKAYDTVWSAGEAHRMYGTAIP